MRFDDVYLAGCGSFLPPAMSAEEALRQGLTDSGTVAGTGMRGVTVSGGLSGPEMAVQAGRRALDASGLSPTDIDLVTFSALYYTGHDMWAAASYVQRGAVGGRCPAVEVRQTSNGGMAALDLAASYLAGGRYAALLTCGDRFCPPGIDRWRSDPGTVFADGGAAVVLARGGGFARLRSIVIGSDTELADLDPSAIDLFVLPHFGRRRMETGFFRPLGVPPERTTWEWARGVGHLGAGDQFAGLAWLRDSGRLRAGQRCALIGVGGGFSWSCAVLEIVS